MSDELVSVVMPVRNAGAWLAGSVDSILQQQYRRFELILVDERCDDGALESLPAAMLGDPRLRVIESPGVGVVEAMRAGVDVAGGDFIARMDADDIASPERLARQMTYLGQRADVGIAGGQVALFRDGGLGEGFALYEAWLNALCEPADIAREIFIECPMPNPTALFRRAVYESLGGYRDSRWPEDYDLFLRARAAGIGMGKPHGVVLRWRDHAARLTRTDRRYSHQRFMQASGYHLARGELTDRAAVIWGAGRCGAQYHDILQSNGVRIDGFIDIHPRRVGGRKRGLPVWPMDALARVGGALIIGAVRARGAREQIRAHLRRTGRREGRDFLFVA